MKHLKKWLAVLLAMGVVGLGSSQIVDACYITSGCKGTGTHLVCGIPAIGPTVHTVVNSEGKTVTCHVFIMRSVHTTACDDCRATLSTDAGMRTCSESHSVCGPRYGLCGGR